MKKVIVFDVDRTLVDSCESEIKSLKEAVEIVTGKPLDEEAVTRLMMVPTKVFFKSLNFSEEDIKCVYEEWDKTFQKYQTVVFPGLKEYIKRLKSDGHSINIITSRNKEEYHELDKVLEDISDCFDVVVTSDIIPNPKPNIDSMTYLCDKLSCTKEEVIYVGDSFVDKEFANNCGSIFIPACWENKDLAKDENACFSVDDLIILIDNLVKEKDGIVL